MAIKDKLTEEFLQAQKEIEGILLAMLFKQHYFLKKGLAYFIEYKKGSTVVEFIFGPSDWDVEMIIYIRNQKYAFKDLLEIPAIKTWVNDNRYKQENGRNVNNELLWFVELLKVSLPIIE